MAKKAKARPFSAKRVYLQACECLHGADCPTCAQITARLKVDAAGRRVIPTNTLDDAIVVRHLEHDVLGRPVDFGDPAPLADRLLAAYDGGDA